MSTNTTFGATLQLGGGQQAVDMKTQLAAAKDAMLQLATAADAGGISLDEFAAASKPLLATIRELERANKVLVQSERERDAITRREIEGLAEQVTSIVTATNAVDALADAKRRADAQADLAHQAELEAAEIRHQIATLEDEQRQIEETAAAKVKAAHDMAQADAEMLAEAGRLEQQQREVASATQALTAIDHELNATLRDDAAAQARTKLAALEAEARDVCDAFARGEIEGLQFVVSLERIESESTQAKSQLQSLAAAAGTEATAVDRAATASTKHGQQLKETGKATVGWQQNIQGLSYSMNDFFGVSGDFSQRLNALANNLPMLLAGFGGVGLVLSGIVPIVAMLIKNWDALKQAITGVASTWAHSVDGMKEKLTELEAKKIKIGTDLMEIESLKGQIKEVEDAIRAVQALKGQQSETERKSGQGFKRATQDTVNEKGEQIGGEEVARKLQAELLKQMLPNDQALIEAREKLAKQEAESTPKIKTLRDQAQRQREGGFPLLATISENTAQVEQDKVDAAGRNAESARRKVEDNVRNQLGKDLGGGEHGQGPDQAASQVRIADLARRAGLKTLADDIDAFGQAVVNEADRVNRKLRDKQSRVTAAEAEAKKISDEGDRAGAAELAAAEQRQKAEIAEMSRKLQIADEAVRLQVLAKERGLSDADAYEEVWRGVYTFLRQRLKTAGVLSGGEEVTAAAKQAAGQAPGAGAQAKEGLEEAGLNAEARVNRERIERQSTALEGTFAKPLGEEFARRLAQNAALAATGGPVARTAAEERRFQQAGGVAGADFAIPQKEMADRMRRQMSGMMQQSTGMNAQASNLAASDIAQKATVEANQAMLAAMGQGVQAVQALLVKLRNQAEDARKMGETFNQVARRANEHQPTAQNMGGP